MPPLDAFGAAYRVREAVREDLDALVDMIGQMARHHGDSASIDAEVLARDAFDDVPWVSVLVAEMDTSLLGYAILCPLYRAQYGQRGMDLHHLFVRPETRRKGVGRTLIESASAHARSRGCRYVLIGTSAENVAARGFYLGLGFHRASVPGPRFQIDLH